jgi:hypothetical protein
MRPAKVIPRTALYERCLAVRAADDETRLSLANQMLTSPESLAADFAGYRAEFVLYPRPCVPPRRRTSVVPLAMSDPSRRRWTGDVGDDWDAERCIANRPPPAGGRAVAGSNPVSPIDTKAVQMQGFRRTRV